MKQWKILLLLMLSGLWTIDAFAQINEPDSVVYADMAPFLYLNGPNNGGSPVNLEQTYIYPYGGYGYTARTAHVNVTYRNGFGGLLMAIDLRQTPDLKHLIHFSKIDTLSLNRTISYLPYASAGIDSYIQPDVYEQFNQQQKDFYTNPPTGMSSNAYPYGKTVVTGTNSIESGGIGTAWQPQNPNIPGSGHTNKVTTYLTDLNDSNLSLWMLTSTGIAPDTSANNFDDNKVIKTIEMGPDWVSGKTGTTESYTDQYGLLLQTREYIDETNYVQTGYVYDILDRLCYVITPNTPYTAIDEGDGNYEKYLYAYRYDDKGRLFASKFPQKGWSYTVYDKLDRPVLGQDALLREKSQWAYVKYDKLGRGVTSGIHTTASNREQLQAEMDAQIHMFEIVDTLSSTGYSSRVFPDTATTDYIVNYYDSYHRIPQACPYVTTAEPYSKNINGLPVASRTRILGTNDFLWQTVFYDHDLRPVVGYSQNALGGHDKAVNEYDYAGLLLKSYFLHLSATDTLRIRTRYAYDHRGRPLREYMKVNDDDEIIRHELEYNTLGQVIRTKTHSTDGGDSYLQYQNLRYHENGSLKAVNDIDSLGSGRLAAFELFYEDAAENPKYNGSISALQWKSTVATPGVSRVPDHFSYGYDGLDRLTTVRTASNGSGTGDYDENFRYDQLGNITALSRYAEVSGSRSRIDSLHYTYDRNRHTRIDNLAAVPALGFQELTQSDNEYRYNTNGMLIADDNKGISSISYNAFGLVDTVKWSSGNRTVYTYLGNGARIRKETVLSSVSATTHYVNSVQYAAVGHTTPALQLVQLDGGRLRKIGTDFKSEYDVTDHLGNVRLTFDADPTDPALPRVLQHNMYYAFGGTMPGLELVSGEKNKYLYNGKELQEETGWYDYGFRMYDTETGRWIAADPMSEKHYARSPYSYALNNPLRYIDPMGLDTLGFGEKMPENATPGQIYRGGDGTSWRYDGNSWSIYNDDSNWSGDINEVVVFGSKGRSSSTTMTTNAGNIAFQNLMDRHNYMLTLLIEGSNSRWAEMEAQRRLQDALRRAEVARDHRDAMVARERAQALKQGIQENARNGRDKASTTDVLKLVQEGALLTVEAGIASSTLKSSNAYKLPQTTINTTIVSGIRVPTSWLNAGAKVVQGANYLNIVLTSYDIVTTGTLKLGHVYNLAVPFIAGRSGKAGLVIAGVALVAEGASLYYTGQGVADNINEWSGGGTIIDFNNF